MFFAFIHIMTYRIHILRSFSLWAESIFTTEPEKTPGAEDDSQKMTEERNIVPGKDSPSDS